MAVPVRFQTRAWYQIFCGFLLWGAAACSTPGCQGREAAEQKQQTAIMTEAQITEALKVHTDALMAMPGVTGTAQGLCGDSPCIVVYIHNRNNALESKISERLQTFPHRFEVTGEFRALPKQD